MKNKKNIHSQSEEDGEYRTLLFSVFSKNGEVQLSDNNITISPKKQLNNITCSLKKNIRTTKIKED